MRLRFAVILGTALLVSAAQADPLPAGKPAGLQQAALGGTGMVIAVTLGTLLVVGGLGTAWGHTLSTSATSATAQ